MSGQQTFRSFILTLLSRDRILIVTPFTVLSDLSIGFLVRFIFPCPYVLGRGVLQHLTQLWFRPPHRNPTVVQCLAVPIVVSLLFREAIFKCSRLSVYAVRSFPMSVCLHCTLRHKFGVVEDCSTSTGLVAPRCFLWAQFRNVCQAADLLFALRSWVWDCLGLYTHAIDQYHLASNWKLGARTLSTLCLDQFYPKISRFLFTYPVNAARSTGKYLLSIKRAPTRRLSNILRRSIANRVPLFVQRLLSHQERCSDRCNSTVCGAASCS